MININLVLMMHELGASDQDVIDYQIQYGLDSKESAVKYLEFLKDPLYRSYACLYPMGRQLVYDHIEKRFHTILAALPHIYSGLPTGKTAVINNY